MTYNITDKKLEGIIDLETAIREEHIIGFEYDKDKSFIIQTPNRTYICLNFKEQGLSSKWDSEYGTLRLAAEDIKDLGYTITKSFTTYEEAVKWYLED